MSIEHPDHTGVSANPAAPWNQEEAAPLICCECWHEPDEGQALPGDQCVTWWDAADSLVEEGSPGVTHCDGSGGAVRCLGHYETKVDDE